jgi:hypothetical protein
LFLNLNQFIPAAKSDFLQGLTGANFVQLGQMRPAAHEIRMKQHGQPHNQPQTDLTDQLKFSLQTCLVLFEDLDVIIHKANHGHPDGPQQDQPNVAILNICPQQGGNQWLRR